ncbi:unnamed protein product [Bursaphelenchus xylophilus]|uniref:(pine wood nematode) hypothetical protein n=1 Tax=Bursaphelenchus xylophilus TaxID=6326 RepID=A0A1I7RUS7_BURXY|nr:unnamed protein product [Bursaphelenchus xylophilus]CAG9105500.1 unnamed protein product [Bursaphelenchus xylophilus]
MLLKKLSPILARSYTIPPIRSLSHSYKPIILDHSFPLKNNVGNVRIEVAQPCHKSDVVDFTKVHFARREPMMHFWGVDPETMIDASLGEIIEYSLSTPFSVLAFLNDDLVGVSLISVYKLGNRKDTSELKIPKDFGTDIHQLRMYYENYEVAAVLAFLNYFNDIAPSFLPIERGYVGQGHLSVVDSGLEGHGIHTKLVVSAAQQMASHGIGHYFGVNTSADSLCAALTLGFEEVYSFPFSEAKIHGKPMFPGGVMIDGGKKMSILIADNEHVARFYERKKESRQRRV